MQVWPKGGAVAFAAFREGVRQPMFWVLFLFGLLALIVSLVVPYFTFGEDLVMVKDLGFDTMMLAAALFGAIAASQSISEEIEGRTAVTLMSKPVSRRQFLLGKFLGILLASLLMFALLGWVFEGLLPIKSWLDRLDPDAGPGLDDLDAQLGQSAGPGDRPPPRRGPMVGPDAASAAGPGDDVLGSDGAAGRVRRPGHAGHDGRQPGDGFGDLFSRQRDAGPGADRPRRQARPRPPGPVAELLSFTAGLFNILLPDLDAFRIGPALVADIAVPAPYVLSVLFYGVLYTLIVLLLGLVLFEDRDLA